MSAFIWTFNTFGWTLSISGPILYRSLCPDKIEFDRTFLTRKCGCYHTYRAGYTTSCVASTFGEFPGTGLARG